MSLSLIFQLTSISLIAVASGLVGTFALMRRMVLAADSISHVALPGLAMAILIGIHPLIGGAVALFLGVLLIWLLENKTNLNTDVIIGVVFAASLAIGSLLTKDEELIEALFGGGRLINIYEFIFSVVAALLIIAFIALFKEGLIISLVSHDLAQITGVKVERLSLYFLLVFALNIILGLQFLGVLLMGSLLIVPAAIGRNLGESINSALVWAAAASLISVLLGYLISSYYGLPFGPTAIIVSTLLFLLSLLRKSV